MKGSVSRRLRALERRLAEAAGLRLAYSHCQIIRAAMMRVKGASWEEIKAAIGAPEAILKEGQPSIAQAICETVAAAAARGAMEGAAP
jgi:hypothetical protein